jgi:putative ABC transport system permease protein
MALRNIERRPTRSLLTMGALALATGILIVPNAFRDGIDYVLNYQWDLIQRQTVFVSMIEPGPARTLADFQALPGVVLAEPVRGAAVELRAGNHFHRTAAAGRTLSRDRCARAALHASPARDRAVLEAGRSTRGERRR